MRECVCACIKTTHLSLLINSATLAVASQITESKLLCNYTLKVRQSQLCSLFYSNSCIITCKLVEGGFFFLGWGGRGVVITYL